MSCSIGLNKLAILTTGLFLINVAIYKDRRVLTKTIPDPQHPDHVPPVNDIQFLCPKGVGPTDIFGFNVTAMRKSRVRLG
jgi:hypothetical protein